MYCFILCYLCIELVGLLFECMCVKFVGIVLYIGMSGVFQFKGLDVYWVEVIEVVLGLLMLVLLLWCNLLEVMWVVVLWLVDVVDFDVVLEVLFVGLWQDFDIYYVMVLLFDGSGQKLFIVVSCGYGELGIGLEIVMGDGVIGVVVCECMLICIVYMIGEYVYGCVVCEVVVVGGLVDWLEIVILLFGLFELCSQLVVLIVGVGWLVGVLYVESLCDLCFGYDDEDVLVMFGVQFGLVFCVLCVDVIGELLLVELVVLLL